MNVLLNFEALLSFLFYFRSVKQKASVVRNTITKLGKMTPLLDQSIQYARSINELDHIVSKALSIHNCSTLEYKTADINMETAGSES
jgi:transcriptional accessory protein Tex/SPT6